MWLIRSHIQTRINERWRYLRRYFHDFLRKFDAFLFFFLLFFFFNNRAILYSYACMIELFRWVSIIAVDSSTTFLENLMLHLFTFFYSRQRPNFRAASVIDQTTYLNVLLNDDISRELVANLYSFHFFLFSLSKNGLIFISTIDHRSSRISKHFINIDDLSTKIWRFSFLSFHVCFSFFFFCFNNNVIIVIINDWSVDLFKYFNERWQWLKEIRRVFS